MLAVRPASQDPALRTDIDLPKGVEAKVRIGEFRLWFRGPCSRVDAILKSLLVKELWISFAKLDVRDVSVQLFPLAER